MTKTLDDRTAASHPGGFRLSLAKLKILQPELFGPFAWFGWYLDDGKLRNRRTFWLTRIEEHLLNGDSRAAVVVATYPLLVAAYTDEIDCVALLRFHDRFVSEYNLERGSRLITVNTYDYGDGSSYEIDLNPGPKASERYYQNFMPLIADFFTDDLDRLNKRKAKISEEEWRRAEDMGQSYLRENYAPARDGRPFWSFLPYEQLPDDFPSLDTAKPATKPASVSILQVAKTIGLVVAFTLFVLWGIAAKQVNPRTRVYFLVLFGVMLVLSLVELFRLPTDIDTNINIKPTLKKVYMSIGVFAVSLLYGLAGELIFGGLKGFWPNFAIWLTAFATTLALYPFRSDDMKKECPTLKLWAVYSGLFGLLSVALAHFFDWLDLR